MWLFASYRDRAGTAEVELALPEGSSVGRLAEEMLRQHPAIISDPSTLVVAVNQEFADHDQVLSQ